MTKQEEETAIVQDQLHEEISRFQAEVQAVKESKVAALDKVRRESAERQHHLESRLATLEEQLGVVGPVMRALVADYRALREKCLALPGFIKKEVEATTRKVCPFISLCGPGACKDNFSKVTSLMQSKLTTIVVRLRNILRYDNVRFLFQPVR